MRKLLVLTLTATLAAAALAPAVSARHTLRHRVAVLEAKMNCLARVPVAQFPDLAWFGLNTEPDLTGVDPSDPTTFPPDPLVNWGSISALDLAYGSLPKDFSVRWGWRGRQTCSGTPSSS